MNRTLATGLMANGTATVRVTAPVKAFANTNPKPTWMTGKMSVRIGLIACGAVVQDGFAGRPCHSIHVVATFLHS